MFRHGLQIPNPGHPSTTQWPEKFECDCCVKWTLDIHPQNYTQKKLAKSLTSEYKKITDKSGYFGSLSNVSANLIFAGDKLLLMVDWF